MGLFHYLHSPSTMGRKLFFDGAFYFKVCVALVCWNGNEHKTYIFIYIWAKVGVPFLTSSILAHTLCYHLLCALAPHFLCPWQGRRENITLSTMAAILGVDMEETIHPPLKNLSLFMGKITKEHFYLKVQAELYETFRLHFSLKCIKSICRWHWCSV